MISDMDEEIIQKIQERVVELLPKDNKSLVGVLLSDCCSEISRLVAGWIRQVDKHSRLLILKGDNVCNTLKSHDILAVIDQNGTIYIIDPTVWQFFPEKKTILVSVNNGLGEALGKIKKIYGGEWKISEEITSVSKEEQEEYREIISQNIRENLDQK